MGLVSFAAKISAIRSLFKHRRIEIDPEDVDATGSTILSKLDCSGIVLDRFRVSKTSIGQVESQIRGQGIAIELVLDISGSMSALDFQLKGEDVNRITAVKHVVSEFIQGSRALGLAGRKNDLVGTIAFGGFADSKCPLTLDHGALRRQRQESGKCQSLFVTAKGGVINEEALQEELATAIGDGVALGIDRLRDAKSKSKVLVLLTGR